MRPVKGARQLRITFDAQTSDTMPWKFRPTTREVRENGRQRGKGCWRTHTHTNIYIEER